jgi:hypothetical protein
LIARWSSSTKLLRCLTWRVRIGKSRPTLIISMAAVVHGDLVRLAVRFYPFKSLAEKRD